MIRSKKKQHDAPSLGRYLQRAGNAVPYVFRTLALIWRAAPHWTVWWIALLLVQGFLPVLIVYLTRPLVNGITAAVASGAGWRPILLPAALMAAALLLTELLRGVTQWIRTVQSELVQDHITALIHRKSLEADLAFYESPEFYDHLHRARNEATYRPIALLETLGNLLRNGITLVAMLIVLANFGPWLPVALLASTLPVFAVVLRDAVRQHEFRIRVTPIERRAWYHDWLLTTGESAAELRLFALGDHITRLYRELRKRVREERLSLVRRQGAAQLFAGVSALAVTAIAMVLMLSRTLAGMMSLGDLALFYQAFQQGLSLARSTLENVGQLYQNSLFLGSLFEFLSLEPRVISPKEAAAPPPQLRDGIHFENVTFRYPGTGRIALRDFTMTIPAGRLVAIVGPNGAGKSTLLKLLCRFYDPESGSIQIDGVDLRCYSLEELRRRMTVLFQQPVRFNATVRDNIQYGDLTRSGDDLMQVAAANAGADNFIKHLPDGYDQMLGHSFSKGTELSVGEWQRVALARAFLRQAPIIVLDEPTSAMDPWAEADWLHRLRALAQGRTAILITHRFTTAMLADEIHVIEQGGIVESGPHAELITRKGRYADWWAMQNLR
jgi:ATP-binding cassette, subfamily B, bacterial